MGYKVFDYECTSVDCDLFQVVTEEMVKEDEEVSCNSCHNPMSRVATATRAKGRLSTYEPHKGRHSRRK